VFCADLKMPPTRQYETFRMNTAAGVRHSYC
jgi:hypothetical protein